MISSEVQRTLVKSPPELWAELSDPAALARHLGELGEIKITKIEPEQTVEWEAEAARGKVELKPSGWGTKVTLSVFQELPALSIGETGTHGESGDADQAIPEQSSVEEIEASAADEAPAETDAETHEASEVEMNEVSTPQPHEDAEVQAREEPAEQAPRLGFFARLFRRKAKRAADAVEQASAPEAAVDAPEAEQAADPAEPAAVAAPEAPAAPDAAAEPATAAEPNAADAAEPPARSDEPTDLSAELAAAEAALAAQTTRVLTLALDRLGAAHHRPFSRA
jgi:hypothetical protein